MPVSSQERHSSVCGGQGRQAVVSSVHSLHDLLSYELIPSGLTAPSHGHGLLSKRQPVIKQGTSAHRADSAYCGAGRMQSQSRPNLQCSPGTGARSMVSNGSTYQQHSTAPAQRPPFTLYSALPGLAGLDPGGLRGSRLPPGEGVAMGTGPPTPLCWLSSASLSLRMARRLQWEGEGRRGGGGQHRKYTRSSCMSYW